MTPGPAGLPRAAPRPATSRTRTEPGQEQLTGALQGQVEDLRRVLAGRPVIEQAKGAVMLRFRIDADAAFAVLSQLSQDSNTKMRDVAFLVCGAIGSQEADHEPDPILAQFLDLLVETAGPGHSSPGPV